MGGECGPGAFKPTSALSGAMPEAPADFFPRTSRLLLGGVLQAMDDVRAVQAWVDRLDPERDRHRWFRRQ